MISRSVNSGLRSNEYAGWGGAAQDQHRCYRPCPGAISATRRAAALPPQLRWPGWRVHRGADRPADASSDRVARARTVIRPHRGCAAAASPLSGSLDRIAVQRSAAPRRVPERVGPAPAGSRGFAGSRARWQHCCGRETARAAARQGASVARAAARSALLPGAGDCRGGCDRTGKA